MNRYIGLAVLGVIAAELGYLIHTIQDIKRDTTSLSGRIDKLEDVISTGNKISFTDQDVKCLTDNIYWESAIENDIGRLAVANVTVNRVKDGRWGHTVCQVVYARQQFSWTIKHKHRPKQQPDPTLWNHCRDLAVAALNGVAVRGAQHSEYYHANYIAKPTWATDQYRLMSVGHHIFYSQAR